MLTWIRHRRLLGLAFLVIGPALVGLGLSSLAAGEVTPTTTGAMRTLHETTTSVRLVTIHVRGKVIRRHDHILVVYVPRTVFHTRTTPSRRIVVPAHVVRIKRHPATPFSPPVALVSGVAPVPVTVTVPVDVTVPGPTTTVVSTQVVTVTEPVPTTVTVTVSTPLTD